MIDDIDGSRLARFIAGECSAEEAEQIRSWIAADPAREELVESLRQVWEATNRPAAAWDQDAAWKRFAEMHAARQVRPIRAVPGGARSSPKFSISSTSPFRRVAAAVLIAGAAGVLGRLALREPISAPVPAPMRTYATARGERAETRLKDGTRVLLAPDSRLQVPAEYGAQARTVHLEGEAYFEVTHDEARPFAVRARNAVALDLGTRFGVRAYAEEAQVQVVVAEGKVSLSAAGVPADSASLLTLGKLGRLDSSGTSLVVRGVDPDRYLGWTDGKLVFRGTPLREAAIEIGRWFDVELRLASAEIGEKRLNAAFRQEPVSEVVHTVATALNLRVVQEGGVYTLGPK